MSRALNGGPFAVALAMALAAGLLTASLLGPELARLKLPVDGFDIGRMALLYSSLPRIVVALLCGAALALSGVILQQALRNPLASPETLGISAGAKLALALAGLYAPSLIGFGREAVALVGAAASTLLVFGLAGRRSYSPYALVLAGLVVSLYCGALAATLVLMSDRYLVSLFIWGGGSLAQQDWNIALSLLPRIAVLMLLAALLVRPLALLDLGDASASSLGLSAGTVQAAGIAVAVTLAAVVISAVGVIGFVGLVTPAISRLAGARRLRDQLIWTPMIGAALLWLTDEAVQWLAGEASAFIPTGAVTALFGSPLLLLLLPRIKKFRGPAPATTARAQRAAPPVVGLPALAMLLVALVLASLFVGRAPDARWTLLGSGDLAAVMPFRLPRVAAALVAGGMLATAGTILQRLTGNEMASPEVLGLSAGATLGVAVALFLLAEPSYGGQVGFAAVGALSVLLLIQLFGRRSGYAPERVVLAGIALGALLDALVGALSASGDPRAIQLMRWMSGSTYSAYFFQLFATAALAVPLISLAMLLRRWLDILPLGSAASVSVGVDVRRARLALFGLAAALTAVASLIAGPLSFVGLMAPHIARELGMRRAFEQLAAAMLTGAALMVAADWTGRMAAFPYEIPAGLVSALIGAPFLMLLVRRLGR